MKLSNDDKKKNFMDMMKAIGDIFKTIPECKVRDEYKMTMFKIAQGSVPLEMIVASLHKKIKASQEVKNLHVVMTSKEITKVWKDTRDVVIDTYNKNRG